MAKKTTPKKKPEKKSKPVEKRTTGQKIFRFVWKTALWFNIVSIFLVLLFKFVPVPFTPLMAIRAIEQKMDGKEVVFSHKWVAIENISPNLQKAVIASEDGKFLEHNGFDFKAMEKAFEGNKNGKKIKGGSTISQQTAKNVFLWPGRSYIRKAFEAYFTVLIELFWSKERIMEVYLNSIEMGDGVYGAQAAAKHWYRKEAKNLSPYEAAGIAAILPSPRKYKATNSGPYVARRKATIARYIPMTKLDY
ncbi:monofunctional biosynthetic peptidoglycan transglycosylase [Flavobacterium tibetense]|uniref:Biosynthetic peptidoglycan transglycosylase n=1 Tax=Flavobacterium tibetense TaxID=2233533 RepID=A0A365NZ00_9FLAO|nr:monofunctional biosynthetic peptidoglycan transglycosylase [Flavobacterium tibetense]RBA27421.1 monofunctional biosynthetic peptidoglycan transglycosylase [Flavobacterium tibetense]